MRLAGIRIVMLWSAVTALCGCSTLPDSNALIALQLESKANTPDGCVSCGCRLIGELEPGSEGRWWLVFGLVSAGDGQQSQTLSTANHCGNGSFQSVRADFEQIVGIPYAVADLAITARASPAKQVDLGVRMTRRKFSGFDSHGLARYERNEQVRSYRFQGQTEITLPLMIAGEGDSGGLGVHEVLVRLEAELLGAGYAASFGRLRVHSDVAGASVMLDGQFVGRTAEDNPFVLANVPVATVNVSVEDFSGRTAERRVSVRADETVDVQLDVLKMSSDTPAAPGLIPVGRNPQGYREFWRAMDGALLVEIPEGDFLMGNPGGEKHEQPQHRVYLSPYLMDKTEVTWRQFGKYVEATSARPPPEPVWGTPQSYPASLVNWREADAYCRWVGGRLPTEAEWEKAARGTDGRTYQWGNEWDPRRCNAISGGPHRPESAGSFPGCYSPYGVLDLSGSMWEWTLDWYQADYYSDSSSRDPAGPASGKSRAIRGGGWMTQPTWLRASYRFRLPPTSRRPDLGFRCVYEETVQ